MGAAAQGRHFALSGRPEVDDADRLQALRADFVAGEDAGGLLLDLAVDLRQPRTPGPDVQLALAPLFLCVEVETQLRVVEAVEIPLDAPALSLDQTPQGSRLCAPALAQLIARGIGRRFGAPL